MVEIVRWLHIRKSLNFFRIREPRCKRPTELELPELVLRDLKLLQITKLNGNSLISWEITQFHHHYIWVLLFDLGVSHEMPLLDALLVFFPGFVFLFDYSVDNFVLVEGLEFVKHAKIINREIV